MKNLKLCLSLVLTLALLCGSVAFAQDYTATTTGFGGDVKVTLTIEDKVIVNASAEGVSETKGIGTKALEQMPAAMVAQNAVVVDLTSGATITAMAVEEAALAALELAGLKPEDLVPNAVAEESTIVVPTFENPDVIVVGGGSAGVNAAIAAAEAGAKVYLIEKNDDIGGSICYAGGTTSAGGTQMQIDAGLEDSPENFAMDIVRMGGGTNVEELTRKHTEMAPAAIDWLDSIGADFGDRVPKMSSSYDAFNVAREYRVTGGGVAIMALFRPIIAEKVEEGSICLMTNTEVADIIVEDGAVKGVVLSDGREFRAPATVLATGGYGHNEELLKRYNYENVLTMSPSFVTGDGYVFAEKAGAQFNNMDYLPAYPGGVPEAGFDVTTTAIVKDYNGVIWVNTDGERIVNEYNALDSERKAAYASAPHNLVYMILTQEMRDTQSGILSKDAEWAKFDALLADENCVYQADSIEALAEKIGVDAAGLAATIEAYNADVEKGEDTAFGRPAESMMKLEGPFYAVKTCPYVMLTKGGPLMTTEAQTLNTEGEPIVGLYQAGELVGGANLGGSANIGGLANTTTIVWGKIAGQSAAAYAESVK